MDITNSHNISITNEVLVHHKPNKFIAKILWDLVVWGDFLKLKTYLTYEQILWILILRLQKEKGMMVNCFKTSGKDVFRKDNASLPIPCLIILPN